MNLLMALDYDTYVRGVWHTHWISDDFLPDTTYDILTVAIATNNQDNQEETV